MKRFLVLIFILTIFDFTKISAQEPVTVETEVEVKQNALDKGEAKLKEIFVPIYKSIEEFRIKQAKIFVATRDSLKVKLGIVLTQEATDKLKDFLAPPQAPNLIPQNEPQASETKKLDNPADYAKLILFIGLATLFLSVWMFYTVLILLLLAILRLIFRSFF